MAFSSTTNAITTHTDDASARLQYKSLCFPPFSRNPTEFTIEDSKFLSTDTLVHQTWTLLDKKTDCNLGRLPNILYCESKYVYSSYHTQIHADDIVAQEGMYPYIQRPSRRAPNLILPII